MARHARWSNTVSSRLGFDLYSGNAILNSSFFSSDRKDKEKIQSKIEPQRAIVTSGQPKEPNAATIEITHECSVVNTEPTKPQTEAKSQSSEASPTVSQHSSYLRVRGDKKANPKKNKEALQKRLSKAFVRNVLKREPVSDVEVDGTQQRVADSKFVSEWMLKMDEVRDAIKSRNESRELKEVASEETFDQLDFNVDDEGDIIRTSQEIISKLNEDSRRKYSHLLQKPKSTEDVTLRDFDEDFDAFSGGSDDFFPRKIDSWFPGKNTRRTRKKVKKSKSYDLENEDVDEQFQSIRMAIKIDEPEIIQPTLLPKTRKKLTKKKSRHQAERMKNEFTSSVSAFSSKNIAEHLNPNTQAKSKKRTIPIEVLRPDILLSWNSDT